MLRIWHRMVGAALLGTALAAPLTGCLARPAPRPTPSNTGTVTDNVDVAESRSVTATVSSLSDTGLSRAMVLGDVALVALHLNAPVPGGTAGGSVGYVPGVPGGGISAGGWAPGGTPNWTQAAPNVSGDLQTQSGTSTSPTAAAGIRGSAPMDVMHRTSDQVRARHPRVKEVRFVNGGNDAVRLAVIAQEIEAGRPPAGYVPELKALHARSTPAGTTLIPPTYPGASVRGRR